MNDVSEYDGMFGTIITTPFEEMFRGLRSRLFDAEEISQLFDIPDFYVTGQMRAGELRHSDMRTTLPWVGDWIHKLGHESDL